MTYTIYQKIGDTEQVWYELVNGVPGEHVTHSFQWSLEATIE